MSKFENLYPSAEIGVFMEFDSYVKFLYNIDSNGKFCECWGRIKQIFLIMC